MLHTHESVFLNEDEIVNQLINRFVIHFSLEPRQAANLAIDLFDILKETDSDLSALSNLEL